MTLTSLRKALVVAAGLACACGTASGQFVDKADTPELVPLHSNPTEPADMVFEANSHEFGVVSDEASLEHVFTFTNKGTGELIIVNAKGSCSCTVPDLEKKQYAPGESGQLRVIFDPHNKRGEQHQTVTINCNDAETPVITLNISANVIPMVMVEPRVAHFGAVDKDKPAELSLLVTGRNPEFKVTGASIDDVALFDVVVGETKEAKVGEEGKEETVLQASVTVKLKPGAPVGLIRNKMLRITTNDEKNPELSVEVMAEHRGDIDVVPKRVALGSLTPGQQFEKEVVVRSLSGKPFKILSVDHENVAKDAVAYTITPEQSEDPTSYRIVFSGSMPLETRTLRGRLVLHTDVEREQDIFVSYYGQQRPQRTQPVQGAPVSPTVAPPANPPAKPDGKTGG